MRLWLIPVMTLFAVLLGTTAQAAEPGPGALPITVVTVKSDDAFDQAEALTQALRKAVRDSDGYSLGKGDYSLEFLALKLHCKEPIDSSCEAKLAEVIRADRFLWTVINLDPQDEQNVTGHVNLFVRGKGTHKHKVTYSKNLTEPGEEALIELANESLRAVTGGAPKGGLSVSVSGEGDFVAQLFVDGEPRGAIEEEGTTI
ncbi:hypothetical protein JYT22_00425 [Endomicrobium sp. AH-315-J14]|nr:hypothetical protein [Endomicrobium sp. AH-315-J14]